MRRRDNFGDRMKLTIAAACAGVVLAGVATPAAAQTIYPINRAQILTGAAFDLKVESPVRRHPPTSR